MVLRKVTPQWWGCSPATWTQLPLTPRPCSDVNVSLPVTGQWYKLLEILSTEIALNFFIRNSHFWKAACLWNDSWGKKCDWHESWKICVCCSHLYQQVLGEAERGVGPLGTVWITWKGSPRSSSFFPLSVTVLGEVVLPYTSLYSICVFFWYCDSFTGKVIILCPRESYWGHTC